MIYKQNVIDIRRINVHYKFNAYAYDFKMNLKKNTFKKGYEKEVKYKKENIPVKKNLRTESLKLWNFFGGYSNNLKRDKRDFCYF